MNHFSDEKLEFVNLIERVLANFVNSRGITKTQALDVLANSLGLKNRRQIYKWMKGKVVPPNMASIIQQLNQLDSTDSATPAAIQPKPALDAPISIVVDLAVRYGEMKRDIESIKECTSIEELNRVMERIRKRGVKRLG